MSQPEREREREVALLRRSVAEKERARAASDILCRSLADETHQLRRTLAATAHMCQHLAKCLDERQRAQGDAGEKGPEVSPAPVCAEDGEGLPGAGGPVSGPHDPAAVTGVRAPRAHFCSQCETQLLWQSPAIQGFLLEGQNMQNVIGKQGSPFPRPLPPDGPVHFGLLGLTQLRTRGQSRAGRPAPSKCEHSSVGQMSKLSFSVPRVRGQAPARHEGSGCRPPVAPRVCAEQRCPAWGGEQGSFQAALWSCHHGHVGNALCGILGGAGWTGRLAP